MIIKNDRRIKIFFLNELKKINGFFFIQYKKKYNSKSRI